MNKSSIEMKVPTSADAFELKDKIKQFKGVSKAYVVTCDTIRIYFNADQITAERVISLINAKGRTLTEKVTKPINKKAA